MNTTQEPTIIDPHSTTNQRIVGKLVEREVIACASFMVSECYAAQCQHGAFPEEFFEDLFRGAPDYEEECRENGWHEITEADQKHLEEEGMTSLEASDLTFINPGDNEESEANSWEELAEEQGLADDARDNAPEVLEHWIVTPWAARKLAEHGEATGELFDFHIWGRTTSGQAILLDSVWCDIAKEMEILEGQRNSWAD